MGTSRWDPTDWARYSTTTSTKSRAAIFTSRGIDNDLNPKKFGMRESRNSIANPQATPIIIGVDVSGSMGYLAEDLVKRGIGVTFEEILARSTDPKSGMVPDPHLMVIAIGDVDHDKSPVQATQFETDLTIAKQTEQIFLEGGGGGNSHESYDVAWYMAAMRTSTDVELRGKKGYIFTVGDEETPIGLTRAKIQEFFGDEATEDLTTEQLLAMAEERFHVFHIIVEEGSHVRMRGIDYVKESWQRLLGQRVLLLSDHKNLAEVIISAIQINEGATLDSVAKTWSAATALVVARAVGELSSVGSSNSSGVVRF